MSSLPSSQVTGRPPVSQAPTLLRRDQETAGRVIRELQEGGYCALLGPRYSGKTQVIHAVTQTLADQWRWPCVYLDLYDVEAATQREFFAALANLTAEALVGLPGADALAPDPLSAGSAAFRGFLGDAVLALGRDLVLVLDHLEALPNDLVQALLTSLRAAYMEQQGYDHRLMVLASGALSLATLAVGESSPFRGIARRVFLGGLSEEESEAFIEEQIQFDPVPVSDQARRSLFGVARGDPHLIWRIYRDAADLARHRGDGPLQAEDVEQIAAAFLDDDVYRYAPLQDAVRSIEDDPDLLQCLLLLLDREAVPTAHLPLPLSPDLDPLRLTGVVEKIDGDRYRLRNEIYRRFLARHFNPGRVGQLLTAAGRWDSAIDFLEASTASGDAQVRWDLLTAIVNSMYASEDVGRAAHYLLRGLAAAFGIQDAQVWYATMHETSLRLAARMGSMAGDAELAGEVPIRDDRLEARAYRDGTPLRGPESGQRKERALPLLAPGRRPVGVVTMCDRPGGRIADQRDRDLQLAGYLNQAARALEQVGRRTQELALAGRIQATLLPPAPTLPGWEFAAALRPARLTSGDFYDFLSLPGGRLGIVIADVTDKGMGAALYMALSRTLIRNYAADWPDRPEAVLSAASARMLSDAAAELFVTVFYGVLDPAGGTLTYCNAGHHPPYLIRAAAGAAPLPLGRTGMALGVTVDETWHQQTVALEPGDLLFLYTDGVCDAENRERDLFGRDRLLEVLRRQQGSQAQDLLAAVLGALHQFAQGEAQSDDMTLVAVRRAAPAELLRPAVPREAVTPWRPWRVA